MKSIAEAAQAVLNMAGTNGEPTVSVPISALYALHDALMQHRFSVPSLPAYHEVQDIPGQQQLIAQLHA